MASRFTFSETDKEKIKAAVADLEQESSGEIVPYFVQRSDDYDEVPWFTAVVFAVLSIVIIAALAFTWNLPPNFDPVLLSIIVLSMTVCGYLLPLFISSLRMSLTSEDKKTERVMERAKVAFLDEEIFRTVDRTGILIFISYDEHQVVVLGDSGINTKVRPGDWEEIVALILNGIRNKQVAEGIVKAIGVCKKLLLDNGFLVRPDDKNELRDDLRLG